LLGGVEASPPYFEGGYRTIENDDGTVQITFLDPEAYGVSSWSGPVKYCNGCDIPIDAANDVLWTASQAGAVAVTPKRCAGSLFLNNSFESISPGRYPIDHAKCDQAISTLPYVLPREYGLGATIGSVTWSAVSTPSIYNDVLRVESADGIINYVDQRPAWSVSPNCLNCDATVTRPVLAETYIFLYESPVQ
jgi:hypothetical protein